MIGFVKSLLFVILAPLGFMFIWRIFVVTVNPWQVELVYTAGVPQQSLHRVTLDVIDFTLNHPVRFWWGGPP